jgi:hypothetical protein
MRQRNALNTIIKWPESTHRIAPIFFMHACTVPCTAYGTIRKVVGGISRATRSHDEMCMRQRPWTGSVRARFVTLG